MDVNRKRKGGGKPEREAASVADCAQGREDGSGRAFLAGGVAHDFNNVLERHPSRYGEIAFSTRRPPGPRRASAMHQETYSAPQAVGRSLVDQILA